MNNLIQRNKLIISVFAVMAIAGFMAFHVSCHSGTYSICLLTVCAFILTTFGVGLVLSANPVFVNTSANRGVSIPLRLERPPRS